MPEHRDAEIENAGIADRRIVVVDAGRAAGKDDAGGVHGLEPFKVEGVGMDLAVDLLLADATGDQLGGLRAEIKDDDFLGMEGHGQPMYAKDERSGSGLDTLRSGSSEPLLVMMTSWTWLSRRPAVEIWTNRAF